MLFVTLKKDQLEKLVTGLMETDEVIGPKLVQKNKDGKPVHKFMPVDNFAEIDLLYDHTIYSAKNLFLPYKEELSRFRFDDGDWEQEITYWEKPRVILGMHACDINALLRLDKVFTRDFYPSPYYLARRRNTIIIGIDHMACEGGFCRSMGTDTVDRGFDLFLTDIGDRYFVAVGSDAGYNLLRRVESGEVTDDDRRAYIEMRMEIAKSFVTRLDPQNLPNLMDLQFGSAVWKRWGSMCLSCGSCAMVCPTCYCYDVSEHISMDFTQSCKLKTQYSCNLVDFALVAGGHNFRPDREKRLMYRYYHHFRGFVESNGEPMCVGCNRCGRACLPGINPPDVIRELQAQERT